MKSDFKCLACRSEYFSEVFIEVNTEVDIDNRANSTAQQGIYDVSFDFNHMIEVETAVFSDARAVSNIDYVKNKYSKIDTHHYSCEECGFIMSFTKVKNVVSKELTHDNNVKKKQDKIIQWNL